MTYTAGRAPLRSALSRIGETYGSLTILDIVGMGKGGNANCSAKCVCGSIGDYKVNALATGSTKSCGCLSSSSKKRSVDSRIGKTINNMTLLEVVGKRGGRNIGRYRCGHCSSDHKEARIDRWGGGNLRNCGCQKPNKRTKPEDHIGIKYNHLTLIKITGKNPSGQKAGLYQCSNCGKMKDGISITQTTRGVVKSCGCLNNKAEDAIGTTWNNLKLLEFTQKQNQKKGINNSKGLFECMLCGSHKELTLNSVRAGRTTDCGCTKHHGYTYHKSFKVYRGMIDRCTNPLAKNYPRWGGRGITVCSRWMEPNGQGIINFMADIGDARPSKKFTLHRMWKYNHEGKVVEMMQYSKENCKWAPPGQQAVEQRSPNLKKKVSEFEKLLEEGFTADEIAKKMKLKPQKVAFFLSTMGLLQGYKYKEGDDS